MAKHTAIVLAAGRGSRMMSDIPKQFLELAGKPLICYALQAFQDSFADEIVLVTAEGTQQFVQKEIVSRYDFSKVTRIVSGGRERCESVYRGLKAVGAEGGCVYIHDGARPFADQGILLRAKQCVEETGACAAGMPVKDTIKIVDDSNYVVETPARSRVWQIQTPQAFFYSIVREAYDKLFTEGNPGEMTDDAMVVERMMGVPVKLFEGSWRNLKVTTPEDLALAEQLLGPHTGKNRPERTDTGKKKFLLLT